MAGFLSGLIVIGAALRFYRLDARSLWLDEIITAYAGRVSDLQGLFSYLHDWIDNAPFTYLLTWLLRGFGGSEIVLRLPSVIAGTLCIPTIYFLGKLIARPRVGLLAASLTAVLPFAVWYSQEARAYAFLMLFTSLQMLFAYRSVVYSRWYNWLALSLFTILNLYTHNLALLATVAMSLFVSCALFAEVVGALVTHHTDAATRRSIRGGVVRKLAFAVASGLLTALAYWPWLPALQQFLDRHDLGFGLVSANAPPTPDTLWYFLVSLDLYPVMLLLVVVGLMTCLIWLVRGPRIAGALVLVWTLVPLAEFWLNAHERMVELASRYYSVIYPALLLLVALGMDTLAVLLGKLVAAFSSTHLRAPHIQPRRRIMADGVVFSVLTLLLLVVAVPALAQGYSVPKEDYRGVASFIRSTSQPGAVVLAMGMKGVLFFPESLQYYLDLQQSSIMAVDARTLDYARAQRLAGQRSRVWAVVYHGPNAADKQRAEAQGLEVITFIGMSLIRERAQDKTAAEQAQDLLRWGSASEPRLLSSSRLLDVVSGKASYGPELLPPLNQAETPVNLDFSKTVTGQTPFLDTWALWSPASSLSGSGDLLLSVNENEVNTTITTKHAEAGKTYLLTFRCRNDALQGAQHVFASVHNGETWLDTFPSAKGLLCDSTPDWTFNGFAFTVPQNSSVVTVWLRASGRGSAEFDNVEMKEIR